MPKFKYILLNGEGSATGTHVFQILEQSKDIHKKLRDSDGYVCNNGVIISSSSMPEVNEQRIYLRGEYKACDFKKCHFEEEDIKFDTVKDSLEEFCKVFKISGFGSNHPLTSIFK